MEHSVEKFPSFEHARSEEKPQQLPLSQENGVPISPLPVNNWPVRKTSHAGWAKRNSGELHKHQSKRSVSEVFDNLRQRRGSISANTHELAEALKAPISWKLIVRVSTYVIRRMSKTSIQALCILWYMTSALTNTSSKSILNAFPKPVTLTIIQFACVSLWCLIFAYMASLFPSLKIAIPALKNGIRYPSKEVIATAMPLAVFQLLGHLLSSTATSKIPVSLVHTIKGLSPLFTVLAYRVVFRIRYARATYLSLVPLTVGVMLACSTDFSGNFVGILCAFVGALVFVTQNIFSKKLFNEGSRADAEGNSQSSRRLDKLNLLLYCSGGAFLLTTPVWLLSEGFSIVKDFWTDGAVDLSGKKGSLDHGPLFVEFVFNGIFHFGQNIMAFVLLSMLSPVSYSVASLIKRVWVIVVAIIWFRNPTTPIQAFGVALTFFGLYLYDRNSMDDAAERRAKADHFRNRSALLPFTEELETKSPNSYLPYTGGVSNERPFEFPGPTLKKEDDSTATAQPQTGFQSNWLPPGTKQESTWELGDGKSITGHDQIK